MPDDMVEAHLRGVRNALAAGWRALDAGGAALDAVEAAVVVMEDDDTFDAGRGSFLNRDGRVQLDALIMDGATLRAGGVGCVERVRNPVRAARKILSESPHVYFVGEGAERFALLFERLADQVRHRATSGGEMNERWAELWSRLVALPGEVEGLNLDRGDAFWTVLGELRDASRN